VPADGIRLPIFISGGFGRSPFFGQLPDKQKRLPARQRYIVSVSVTMSVVGQQQT
jgi:hypothetical protein